MHSLNCYSKMFFFLTCLPYFLSKIKTNSIFGVSKVLYSYPINFTSILLEQVFTACLPLLTATSTYGLGEERR